MRQFLKKVCKLGNETTLQHRLLRCIFCQLFGADVRTKTYAIYVWYAFCVDAHSIVLGCGFARHVYVQRFSVSAVCRHILNTALAAVDAAAHLLLLLCVCSLLFECLNATYREHNITPPKSYSDSVARAISGSEYCRIDILPNLHTYNTRNISMCINVAYIVVDAFLYKHFKISLSLARSCKSYKHRATITTTPIPIHAIADDTLTGIVSDRLWKLACPLHTTHHVPIKCVYV